MNSSTDFFAHALSPLAREYSAYAIAAKHSEIISGPFYKGVLSVEMGFAVLSIIAECYEDDYHKVERALIREVLLALRENNVPVR